MKCEVDCDVLTPREVASQMVGHKLDPDERIGECRVECGCDLEVDIMHDDPSDQRIDGRLKYTSTFTLNDLRRELCEGDVYCWAKDEDGNDILLCNN